MVIGSEGLIPADFGVPGREDVLGDLESGNGREAELNRASIAMVSR
jgi:hypothetical protein